MKLPFMLFLLLTITVAKGQSYYDIADAKSGDLSFAPRSIVGLWEIDHVMVGDEELTPTAKWFEFIDGGKYVSGNGGITNLRGSWSLDQNSNILTQLIGDKQDPYGPFNVQISESVMTWERQEDGMKVLVTLKKVSEKPLAPWDKIQGNWVTQKAEELDSESQSIKSEYTLDQDRYYFGWDGRYRKFNTEGKRIETGIWHIEAHSPWLWTISDADNTKTGWSIDIQEKSMIWTKEGDSKILKVYLEKADH